MIKTVDKSKNKSIDVDINYVDIDKTFIIINTSDYYNEGYSGYVTFNSNTSIKISIPDTASMGVIITFCIQVVEFY